MYTCQYSMQKLPAEIERMSEVSVVPLHSLPDFCLSVGLHVGNQIFVDLITG
jgi:hypothetical protein